MFAHLIFPEFMILHIFNIFKFANFQNLTFNNYNIAKKEYLGYFKILQICFNSKISEIDMSQTFLNIQ